jgi:hypothetical protein
MHASDSEDELRAATVWLFVQYSDFSPIPEGAITVGVLGRPSFARALRRTLDGKAVGGHPVKVVEVKSDPHGCQILYIASDKNDEIQKALQATQSIHALVIGETDHFLERGGAVNLFIVDGHIGFETSLEALGRSGVVISSNLLKFGQIRDRKKGLAVR